MLGDIFKISSESTPNFNNYETVFLKKNGVYSPYYIMDRFITTAIVFSLCSCSSFMRESEKRCQ